MRRNQWIAILVAVLLFGCGVLCGILTERYLVNGKTAEDFRHGYVSEMKSKLKLSSDQVNHLEVILDETKAQYKAVRDESRPALLKIKEEQIRRVESILNPQQVPAYRNLIVEREQRYKEQEERDRQADLKRQAAHRARVSR